MRVLAQADHATIEGGQFSLSDDELLQSQQVPWLPRGVEDRIADDPGRTRRIIRAYVERIDPDWPTLVFATSVEHFPDRRGPTHTGRDQGACCKRKYGDLHSPPRR